MEPLSIHRGFSLIELLVVFAIITVVMGIVLSSQSSFNKTLILTNTAYDIALTLRSAETYGISSRGSSVSTKAGYGLHFLSGTTGSFILFSDFSPSPNVSNCHGVPVGGVDAPDAKPGNCAYDGPSEDVSTYVLGNSITIGDFCAYTNGVPTCAIAHGGGLSSLDIVFSRPDTHPFVSPDGSYSTISPASVACLTIQSPQSSSLLPNSSRYVSIGASGQIIANATPCP